MATPLGPTATHVGGGCVAEEHGGGTASRQSSLRAFQYMARPFEVAGFRRGIAGRKGTPTSTGEGGVGRETLLILLLISSRPIPRADVGGKRVKAKEGPKGRRGEGDDRPRAKESAGMNLTYLNVSSRETKTTTNP